MSQTDALYLSYVALINSLSREMRLQLLLVLAASLQPSSTQVNRAEDTGANQTSSYLHLFGSWNTDKQANEIIEEIYASRKDRPMPNFI
jgi:hypothetical protein